MEDEAEFDVSKLNSRDDLRQFLEWFAGDLRSNSAEWENNDLQSFLDALIRYTDDVDGYYRNMGILVDPEIPSWRLFADILCGARVYE